MGLADGLTICLSLAFAAEFFSSSSSRFTESDFCSSSTCSTVSLIFWRPMFRWSCCSSKSERFSLYNLACCGQIRIYSHVLFYILTAAEYVLYNFANDAKYFFRLLWLCIRLRKEEFYSINYLQVYCPCKSTTVFEFTNLQSGWWSPGSVGESLRWFCLLSLGPWS